MLLRPDARTSLQSWSWTRNFLLLNLLRDVSSEIRVLDPSGSAGRRRGGAWASTLLDACPPLHDVKAYAVDDEDEAPPTAARVTTSGSSPRASPPPPR